MTAEVPTGEVITQAFHKFYEYVKEAAGEKKAGEFAQSSYRTIEKYFRNLAAFGLTDNFHLEIKNRTLSDKEILAFSVWMLQFLKELKSFMIGLGKTDPQKITGELETQLKALGFYDYFEQAKELSYG
ncbi:MAG: hypothetical protein Kow0042_12590 [Calditrichia bacterium]